MSSTTDDQVVVELVVVCEEHDDVGGGQFRFQGPLYGSKVLWPRVPTVGGG